MHYDFIEIGTSDFETLLETCIESEKGLSIEPIKYYQDKLPNKPNVKKLNMGISNENGEMSIYYIPEHKIKKYNLPDYLKGCNSVGEIHPALIRNIWIKRQINERLNRYKIEGKDLVEELKVRVINWETLIKNENIESLSFLKIDTEGHDLIILKDYLKNCDINPNLFAKRIEFESNYLLEDMDVDNIIKEFESRGYSIESRGHETILVKN